MKIINKNIWFMRQSITGVFFLDIIDDTHKSSEIEEIMELENNLVIGEIIEFNKVLYKVIAFKTKIAVFEPL
jgi:hypothetical protein